MKRIPLIVAIALATPAFARAQATTGAFVVRLGQDTMAVETFTRTATSLDGILVRRSPSTMVHHYHLALAPDGSATRFDDTITTANGQAVTGYPRSVSVTFERDSAFTVIMRDTAIRRKAAAKNAFPTLQESFALDEPWLARMRRDKSDSITVLQVAPLGGPSGAMPVKLFKADSGRALFFGSPQLMRVDKTGALLGLDATQTTIKYIVTRVPKVDVAQVASGFATRDAAGKPMGVYVSPRDTTVATIGGIRYWVDYGRPSTRGRDVFHDGVLGDTLWRLGANAATQFEIDKPIKIGGHTLAAGKYTLWMRVDPADKHFELVVNSQTGQWGTDHDAAHDLFAVPLTRSSATAPAEMFSIHLDDHGSAGALVLHWGTTLLSVPISA